MSFRQKLLLLFALTVLLCVAVISVSVYSTMRRRSNRPIRTAPTPSPPSFDPNSSAAATKSSAKSSRLPPAKRCSASRLRSTAARSDSGGYVGEARTLAAQQQLDFLELVDHQGTILSSAQWQAKFGYPEPAIPVGRLAIGGRISEARRVARWLDPRPVCRARRARRRATVLRHRRRAARSGLPLHARHSRRHARAALSEPRRKVESEVAARPERPGRRRRQIAPLVEQGAPLPARKSQGVIHWTADSADAEVFHAIPLTAWCPNQQADGCAARRQFAASADRIAAASYLRRHVRWRRREFSSPYSPACGSPRASRVRSCPWPKPRAASQPAISPPRSTWSRTMNSANWPRRSTA